MWATDTPDTRSDGGTQRREAFRSRPGRAQSEVVGVVFLTAVVAALALTVGAAVIAGSTADDSGPTTDFVLEVTASDALLSHNGGDVLDVSALTVVLERGGTAQRFTPVPADTSDGDGRFAPGDRISHAHGYSGGDVIVVVVHRPSNTVIFEERASVPP